MKRLKLYNKGKTKSDHGSVSIERLEKILDGFGLTVDKILKKNYGIDSWISNLRVQPCFDDGAAKIKILGVYCHKKQTHDFSYDHIVSSDN